MSDIHKPNSIKENKRAFKFNLILTLLMPLSHQLINFPDTSDSFCGNSKKVRLNKHALTFNTHLSFLSFNKYTVQNYHLFCPI
jgi:hypothetical protein